MILHIFGLHLISVLAIDYPEVILNQGTVSGFYDRTASGRSFSSFFGIPYAKPPVGKYRFKEAKPAEPWMGTFNATILPSSCLQYDYIHYLTNFAVHGEEDCLFVNVFSPKLPTPGSNDRLLDVIVFIHGGAFMSLDGHSFAPHLIMEKDVVFVTFNYRVGPLGFLSTEDDVIPGNYGLKDQVLALKWIKDNVQAFGGDPQRISLTGLSAGGTSVHYHMLSNKSKGIFRNAMALSGTALNPWSQADGARSKAFRIGRELGCPLTDSRQLLKCLRYRPARQIVSLSKIFMPWLYLPFSPFGPVVEKPSESAFIDRPPIEIMKAGVPNDVPLVLSYTSHEGVFPNAGNNHGSLL
ncbi:hypothetical protein AAG570_000440 [Ranatra chinensis]|uniref:Carboxylic ester hydrolase n=1 Tax=Ranatra chinensis TaxID=642074 RepID=A0ABD0YX21_9HEMI